MRRFIFFILVVLSVEVLSDNAERVVVTGSRIDYYDSPAIMLEKPADFLLQKVRLLNDSRKESERFKELRATVKGMITRAEKSKSIELSVGDEVIYPITSDNLQLDFMNGDREDTSKLYLYIKTPITKEQSAESLVNKINDYIKNTKMVGRTEIAKDTELHLSIKNPEKYRKELLQKIAQDVNQTSSIFGEQYSAEIEGLGQAIQWERASVSTLKLYIEYNYVLSAKK